MGKPATLHDWPFRAIDVMPFQRQGPHPISTFLWKDIPATQLLPGQPTILIHGRAGIRYCLYRSYDLASNQWELIDCQGPLTRDFPVLFQKEDLTLDQPSIYYRLEISLGGLG